MSTLCACAHADYDNFPVKSIVPASAATPLFYVNPDVSSYNIFDGTSSMELQRPMARRMAGKARVDGSSVKKAFCVKLSGTGGVQWVWGSGASGVTTRRTQSFSSEHGDIIVAGYRVSGGVAQRSLTKPPLRRRRGVDSRGLPDGGDSSGAWEMAHLPPMAAPSCWLVYRMQTPRRSSTSNRMVTSLAGMR